MSAENDFIRAMTKKASFKDMAVSFVNQHPKQLATALVGAGLAAGLQLASSHARDGELSFEQRSARAALSSSERALEEAKAEGREPSFGQGLGHATSKYVSDIADVTRKHPVRGALLAAPSGAAAALTILKALSGK